MPLTLCLLLSSAYVLPANAGPVCECLKRSAEEYRLLGYPYVWGDWDCSKFVKQVFEDCGINLERCTSADYARGRCGFDSVIVDFLQREECDETFWTWRGSDRIDGHIGILKNKDEVYHNSSGRGKVVLDKLRGSFIRDMSRIRRYKHLEK